tara:strand:- start:7679 stop:8623 length:945 start_codon:yes stop_codon:yes gene_type:complete
MQFFDMIINSILISASFIMYFCIFNILYPKIFLNLSSIKGSGFISSIIIFVYFFFLNNNIFGSESIYFAIIIVLSVIYFYDDVFGLNILSRIIIQFLSGIICAYLFLDISDQYLIIKLLIFGCWTIFFVNCLNFYDGEDLNFSILIILILVINCLLLVNDNTFFLTLIVILFFIIFSFFNIYLKEFYFGDSGCFAIACFLNYLLITSMETNFENLFVFLAPLFLPILDVIYVIILRLYLKENLTTRNYYHLYQRLAKKYKKYYYLLPTIIMTLTFILYYFIYKYLDINIIYLYMIAFITLVISYFLTIYILRRL